MKKTITTAVVVLVSLFITGCNQSNPKIDQRKLCQVSDDAGAKQCKAGELVYFAPKVFGNEQLPLNIAAAYCDFNYQVMHTKGGVLCVFTDKRLSLVGQ
ncbi:MAG: hypothetical protein A3J81_02655 [Nitrospirae bacterium RIFOXYB2_FULL_43_5]|nr:MAG: hypothetical protein A2X54_10250 [Nitrospirae bacterium GWF2_44_13]OGW66027.1 MAG: hypothetical protein A2222_09095 [Nitrospirae bacterium RIFOXYA2_FULL_44_9]OGW73015.1 MAG: hypothetical protein A3J81_02655 [Nitrospirae bacterium RIFOXYB2_FULL_43_5]OGW74384.1 MAG: hypothetical protein A2484_01605 [Nitrospirae bacterium RIFOXYC2_FULL_44_7]HBG92758.1 hypothetical protein [Nitrospiraceae bacterium]